MNRNLVILLSVVASLMVAVLGFRIYHQAQIDKIPVEEVAVKSFPSLPPVEKSIIINLSPQNSSSESGKATLKEVNGKIEVSLDLVNYPKSVAQPAHIHMNNCQQIGEIVYPLTLAVEGKSKTIIETTLEELKSKLPLSINIHKSTVEAKVYVACGELLF